MITTRRLLLIPGTSALLRADLQGRHALAAALGMHVPDEWPTDLYDEGAIRWALHALESGRFTADWGFHYIALRGAEPGGRTTLIGAGGFKGSPGASRTVEIGYSILSDYRRRGYAREAVDAWVAHSFTIPDIERVVAHTLSGLVASIAVLTSAGFSFAGAGHDSEEPEAVRYELSRATYLERLR